MSTASQGAAALAREWIEAWIAGTPHKLPLAESFTHSSPFGTIEGRDTYFEWMKPMLERGSPPMKIVKVLGGEDEAVVWYDLTLPSGEVPCCDWVHVRDGKIAAITSFYDATNMR